MFGLKSIVLRGVDDVHAQCVVGAGAARPTRVAVQGENHLLNQGKQSLDNTDRTHAVAVAGDAGE